MPDNKNDKGIAVFKPPPIKEFEAPTPKLRAEFNLEWEKTLTQISQFHTTLTPSQRLSPEFSMDIM